MPSDNKLQNDTHLFISLISSVDFASFFCFFFPPSISFEDGLKLVKLRGEAMQVTVYY